MAGPSEPQNGGAGAILGFTAGDAGTPLSDRSNADKGSAYAERRQIRADEGRTPMPHSSRVALITGCGKPIGIGNSTARALAAAGVTVVVSDVGPAGVANEHNVAGEWTRLGRGRQPRRGAREAAEPPPRRSAMSASRPMPGAWSRRCWGATAGSTFSSTMPARRRAPTATRSRMCRSRPGTARWGSTPAAPF